MTEIYQRSEIELYVKSLLDFNSDNVMNRQFSNGSVVFFRRQNFEENSIGFYDFVNDDISKEKELFVEFLSYLSNTYDKIYYNVGEETEFIKETEKENIIKSIELKGSKFEPCDIEFPKGNNYCWKKLN